MSYLNGVKKLKQIESDNDVMSISFKGIPIWPYLRIYLMQVLGHTNNENAHGMSSSKIGTILKSLTAYSPLSFLKNHSIWLFNGQERRKQIGTKWIHRVSGFFASTNLAFLNIEKPQTGCRHLRKVDIEESDIVSEGWFILLSHLIERILRLVKLPKIENENILIHILNSYNLNFNYKYYTRYLWAQKLATDFILKLTAKPKVVFIECPYPIMGYQWSLKKHGIKVIELQHGVLNDSHYAYFFRHSSIFSPDEIWVYGDREKNYFKKINPHYSNIIRETGLYILDRANKEFRTDLFKDYRTQYERIIVFSGQSAVENEAQEFLDRIATLNQDYLFIYIPRHDSEVVNICLPNVKIRKNVNIYEYLKWCDLHLTISSTTCLEASYYGRKTIFFDFQNLATYYYGDYLKDENGVRYIHNPYEFRSAVKSLMSQNTIFKTPFANFKGDVELTKIVTDIEHINDSK